jgi:hypothetical protein
VSAAVNRWRQERHRLRSAARAIERGDVPLASQLLAEAELEAFEHGDELAGELAFARYRLSGDQAGAGDAVRRILERRYG